MGNLTVKGVQALKKPGMHADGAGLYLAVSKTGAKSWILRAAVKGRKTAGGNPYRVEIGLGSASLVPLAEAREAAQRYLKAARQGTNPLDLKHRESVTFESAARQVYEGLLPTWKNAKHAETWLATVQAHAFPVFGSVPIENVTTADVMRVLSPIWTEKHETAKRLSQRLATVFDWAKAKSLYPHENPLNGIKKALPPVKRIKTHLAALPWSEVPAFMRELAKREGVSARTLEFIILTAARSGEARGALWSEFDLAAKVWTVPGARMKRGVEHRVPLSCEALAILERVRGLDEDFVFASTHRGHGGKVRAQSDMVFKSLLRRMNREGFTVHGFRSSFRDWCSEGAHVEREVAELALSHAVGNEVERAYARSDLFERRRSLMERWGQYCANRPAKIVELSVNRLGI